MTKHFYDDKGRRWKAWQASRDVYWPEPEDVSDEGVEYESVIFVCFSDPSQPQRRVRLPAGSFQSMSAEELQEEFGSARPKRARG